MLPVECRKTLWVVQIFLENYSQERMNLNFFKGLRLGKIHLPFQLFFSHSKCVKHKTKHHF